MTHDLHDALIEHVVETLPTIHDNGWYAENVIAYLLASEQPHVRATIQDLVRREDHYPYRDSPFWQSIATWLDRPAIDRCLAYLQDRDQLDALAFLRPRPEQVETIVTTLVAMAKRRQDRAEPLFGLYGLAALRALRAADLATAARLLPTIPTWRWIEQREAAAWRAKLGPPGAEFPETPDAGYVPAWAHHLHPVITRDPLGGAWMRVVLSAEPNVRPGAPRSELPCRWLIYGDIDRILNLNDYCGHLAGDVAISGVVRTMQEVVGDNVIRIAGDAFLILWDGEDGPELAETLRMSVEQSAYPPLQHLEEPVWVTMSFGVVPGGRTEGCIRAAEDAVHEAKSQGRNRVVVWK